MTTRLGAVVTLSRSASRHVSFLETGRSRPSRQMVLRLGEALDVPPRERNHLLNAAGLPVAYRQAELRDRDLAPYLAAVDRLLQAHLPYPAMVLDPYGTVLLANRACHALFGIDVVGANLTHRFLADPAARQLLANWPEVAWAGLDRLRHQRDRTPFDQQLEQLVELAEPRCPACPARSSHPPTRWYARGFASATRS